MITIRRITENWDRDLILNKFPGWNLYLNPGEEILEGNPENLNFSGKSYICSVLYNNILTKEIRIWHSDLKFKNPIYEYIEDENSQFSDIIISGKQIDYDLPEIVKWKNQNLLNTDPYYYEALCHLKHNNYEDFIINAENYFFRSQKVICTTMLRYYLAIVYFSKGNYKESIKNLIFCLEKNLCMAEFWCLLGDIHLALKHYYKSYHFYENAIIFGSRRLNNDLWPLHIPKYSDYPQEKMNLLVNKV